MKKRIIACTLALLVAGAVNTGCKKNGSIEKKMRVLRNPPVFTAQPEIEDPGEEIVYSISRAISSHMVVQRDAAIRIWGYSEKKGGIIYGEFMGEKRYAVIDENGEWVIEFSAHEYNKEPQTMKIYPKNGKVTELEDILIGDVWLITGQSNAELSLAACISTTPEIKDEIKKENNIRLFSQSLSGMFAAVSDYTAELKEPANKSWRWKVSSISGANEMSAMAYYYALDVIKSTDVPQGLVSAAAGGACLRELMPEELAKERGYTSAPTVGIGGYYNTLLAPFRNMEIAGVFFYQGESESNGDLYKAYAQDLSVFFERLRKDWRWDFPIYNVQLSSHGTEGDVWTQLPELRAAQLDAIKLIDNYYLIPSYDAGFDKAAGEPDWAHPRNKIVVGRRICKAVLSTWYNTGDIEYSLCPIPVKCKSKGKSTVVLDFDYVGEGLIQKDGVSLMGFEYVTESGITGTCSAKIISKNQVELVVGQNTQYIQYAMIQNEKPEYANLYAGEFPVPTFRIKVN